MSDTLLEKAQENPVGLLDMMDNFERILPGPTETERNESRLRHIVTGEGRDASHVGKEVAAWGLANGTPFLAAYLKAATVAGMGAKGLKAITKVGGKGGMKVWQEVAEKQAREAAEEAAKNATIKYSKNPLTKAYQMATSGETCANMARRIADSNLKNVETAVKGISSQPDGLDRPMRAIMKYAKGKGAKTLAALLASEKLGRILGKGMIDTGGYGRVKDLEGFDNSIEMGGLETFGHFLAGLFDLDTFNPDAYPMDKIDSIINSVNRKTHKWNQVQIDHMGDDEKIRLVKRIAKGKYDTDDQSLSNELIKAYLDLTNNSEDNK